MNGRAKASGSVITKIADLPEDTRYIVIANSSYVTPGYDDRSDTETVYSTEVYGFSTQEELSAWIVKNESADHFRKKTFVALPYAPLTIKSELKVSFE